MKAIGAALIALASATVSAQGDARVSGVVNTYCATCHNDRLRSPSGLLLEAFDAGRVADKPELWARAYRQLQAGAMPPVGSPRPDRAAVATALQAAIKGRSNSRSARTWTGVLPVKRRSARLR